MDRNERTRRVARWLRVEEGYWFAPKMFGLGATPVTWQGWALTMGFVVALVALVSAPLDDVAKLVIGLAMLAAFTVVVIHKTQGEWRWRWGLPPKE